MPNWLSVSMPVKVGKRGLTRLPCDVKDGHRGRARPDAAGYNRMRAGCGRMRPGADRVRPDGSGGRDSHGHPSTAYPHAHHEEGAYGYGRAER
ncbi:hypothetical protein GCM10009863_63330 [Streptomyces axinellae]|uniref:Uncharacterized protein n=1 Tax=Streptomyces axinellae TaxID=552788 RepID=A0ABP6DAD3_9ACTN